MSLNPKEGILGKTNDSHWSKWVLETSKVCASSEIFTAKRGVNDSLKSTKCLLLPTTTTYYNRFKTLPPCQREPTIYYYGDPLNLREPHMAFGCLYKTSQLISKKTVEKVPLQLTPWKLFLEREGSLNIYLNSKAN